MALLNCIKWFQCCAVGASIYSLQRHHSLKLTRLMIGQSAVLRDETLFYITFTFTFFASSRTCDSMLQETHASETILMVRLHFK